LAVVAFMNVPSYINRVGKLTREFRQLIDARGAALRQLSRQELVDAGKQPTENVTVQGRHATISIIVEPAGDDLRVVVQGFMPARLLPRISNVALDGFYKRANGQVEPMPEREFYEFD
jgi:hypothetical protein